MIRTVVDIHLPRRIMRLRGCPHVERSQRTRRDDTLDSENIRTERRVMCSLVRINRGANYHERSSLIASVLDLERGAWESRLSSESRFGRSAPGNRPSKVLSGLPSLPHTDVEGQGYGAKWEVGCTRSWLRTWIARSREIYVLWIQLRWWWK